MSNEQFNQLIAAITKQNEYLTNIVYAINALGKDILTLEEAEQHYGGGMSDSNIRKKYLPKVSDLADPKKVRNCEKKGGFKMDQHYFHNGTKFYLYKKEVEAFILKGKK